MSKWWLEEYPEPLDINLCRDSYSTPWGFRIAGGLDYGQTPIVVTQVNICTPADGQLAVGDVIISVDHQQVFRRRHFDVLSMLTQEAGGTLELQIYRGATADEIKARSGFNIRFHAPLTYLPVNNPSSSSERAPNVERPNTMYRTVHSGSSGRPVVVSLRRQNPYQPVSSIATPSPSAGRTATQFFYNPQQDEYMLHKVQQSLDALTLGRNRLDEIGGQVEPDYYVPVADKRRFYNQPDPISPGSYLPQHQRQQHRPRYNGGYFDNYYSTAPRSTRAHSVSAGQRPMRMTPSSYSAFIRPRSVMSQASPSYGKAPEFCWMPRGLRARRGLSQPTARPVQSTPVNRPEAVMTPIHVFKNEGATEVEYVPPWKGTLHSASPGAWIEGQMIDPNNPIYQHEHRRNEPEPPAEPVQVVETKEADDGRKVVHLQYNSPLQLYSGDAARKALEDQTVSQGGPEGTLMIKGGRPGAPPQKITDSTVYRMVHEEDLRRQKRLQQGSTPRQHHHHNYPQQQQGPPTTPTASASGQLKVVLSQPPQHQHPNYFQSSDEAAPSGFSDF